MGDALKAVLSPYTAFDDWVIIRAPLTNKNLAKFDLNERVLAFAEAAKSNVAPTMLDAFTVIPLAAALDAKKFPKSIVAHGNCIVAYQRDRCITHLCSAVPGGSGASLFARGTDAPSWVGIHIGPESAEISCSGNGDSISANIALRSSAQLRTHFNTKDAPK